jgi:uncharacterized membrane protein YkvA (DUF1232 family)/antitoxin component HigA of HigAB toxin-antitoxin module
MFLVRLVNFLKDKLDYYFLAAISKRKERNMTEEDTNNGIGLLLKALLKQRSLSMKKFSELTDIDTATISRIINGKRKATLNHLQKFADCLEVSITELFAAAGYPIETNKEMHLDDIHSTINDIQEILKKSNIHNEAFTIDSVKQKLDSYTKYAQTNEGKGIILRNFEKKVQQVGCIGPFIDHLKDMFLKFSRMQGSPYELALIGGALLYFISPIDVIPDYLFPIGYLDDALVIKLVLDLLSTAV